MTIARHILSWLLALALIIAFLHVTLHPWPNPPAGSVLLFDPPGQNTMFQTLAMKSGYVEFEPAGRVIAAFIQLFAALMLLLPWTRKFGAFLAFVILATAVGLHLSPWLGQEIPRSLTPGAETDNGATFSLAVAMLVVSVLVMIVHPGRRRNY